MSCPQHSQVIDDTTQHVTYLAGDTPGLSNELSDPLDAGGNIARRPLLFHGPQLIQELGDHLCEISHCNEESESLGLILY